MKSLLSKDLKNGFLYYKRQTYLLVFPFGILISFLYLISSSDKSGLLFFSVIAMMLELGVFVLMLWRWPHSINTIEYIFYFTFTIHFFLSTQVTIQTAIIENDLTPGNLADNLNSLTMWLIVFLLGAYLTTNRGYVKKLIIFIFAFIVIMAIVNFRYLYLSDQFNFQFVFRWFNPFACLAVATLLFQRMGVLQQQNALTDALTGLLNRHALHQILQQEMDREKRYGKSFSLILVDLDYFKKINDRFGHLKGDTVLVDLARAMMDMARKSDHIGRWGGEEFLLILPETDSGDAKQLAERLRIMIEETYLGDCCFITASIGIATSKPNVSIEELLARTDKALYEAKQSGRNQVIGTSVSLSPKR